MKGPQTMSLANAQISKLHAEEIACENLRGVSYINTKEFELVEKVKQLEEKLDKLLLSGVKVSDSESVGTEGPAGPTGPPGPTGPRGPKGTSSSISELTDINLSGLEDGSVLVWNANDKKWTPAKLE